MNDHGTLSDPAARHEPHPDIAAYALGVLDPEERERLEAHLTACALCRAELDRYETVVGDLGAVVAPVAPRRELRRDILSEIRRGDPVAMSPVRRQVPAAWLGIAAAIAILSLVVVGALYWQVREERDEARDAQHAIADYLKDGGTLAALMPAPGAEGEPGHGSLIVAPDQSGAMLVVYDLMPTTDQRTYRAWAERAGERVDLGELRVNDEGVGWLYLYGPEPMSTYETIGVSRVSPDHPAGEPFLVAPVG